MSLWCEKLMFSGEAFDGQSREKSFAVNLIPSNRMTNETEIDLRLLAHPYCKFTVTLSPSQSLMLKSLFATKLMYKHSHALIQFMHAR